MKARSYILPKRLEKLYGGLKRFADSKAEQSFKNSKEFTEEEFVRWRDELGDVTRMRKVGNRITDDLVEGSVVFAINTDLTDYLITNIQLNHDREIQSIIKPHIHFWQAQDAVPNFLLQYRWQNNLGIKTTDWLSLKTNGVAKAYVSGTLNQIAVFSAISPPSTATLSDIVQFRIIRDNANGSTLFAGADSYAAGVHVVSFDVHIKLDSAGSTDEYVK